ncbi:peptidoglycan recognition protein 6 [Erpetoichthys calabaricus]|uniref:Peptidoglycan recognition protein 2 n=1 Tax=Erpetoichthys calabaricus TaxID=27687 RepID=A0A8C4TLQ4_ERPCA|nr:peptidoglycan recognition protein 6 [Erpetoichthys calabaricus]
MVTAHFAFLQLLLLSLLLASGVAMPTEEGVPSFHMDNVIQIIEELERLNPQWEILDTVQYFRQWHNYNNAYLEHLLGKLSPASQGLKQDPKEPQGNPMGQKFSPSYSSFLVKVLKHQVIGDVESGVVLTPDGTSVAVSPLIIGIEAGLKRNTRVITGLDSLIAATLGKDLGLSLLNFRNGLQSKALGPNGCWDNISRAQVYVLLDDPSPVTDAFINGAMDGVVLGAHLSIPDKPNSYNLSALLKDYYVSSGTKKPKNDVDLRSNFRRSLFAALVNVSVLQDQALASVLLYKNLSSDSHLVALDETRLHDPVKQGIQEFYETYVECPTIIPRCMWGAQPYKGTPTNLTLPLKFVYIHHTYEPGQPCTTFEQCAADMRSMQRFHQNDRQWDDIGYSFVAGSDGYLYEGRGWFWVGAHTKGHNSLGYGVSFIGNYMEEIPAGFTLSLVKDSFTTCGVRKGHLVPNYTIHGHRQLVATSCPGDALYSEISTWKHFKDVQKIHQQKSK